MSEPIIPESTIAALENLIRRFQMQADQAQTTAEEMQSAAKLVNESLKRARELNRTVHVPTDTVRNGGQKATWKTKGVKEILSFLSTRPEDFFNDVTIRFYLNIKQSTVRTYMPILREAGYVQESAAGHRITDAGRAALLS